jgi:RNase P/RNase MRP subunit p29
MGGGNVELSSEERRLLAGELLGAPVHITEAPGITPLPLDGVLVDESLHTFLIRRAPSRKIVRVAKQGLVGTIDLYGREVSLRGDALRVRPEDRTKRLLTGAPRRHR